ncbi:hypothetical protein IM538_08000 [Cytobacillus suaedae]|nr:hypothetical protein IM538_08000 [Cytobacillus suaedae]
MMKIVRQVIGTIFRIDSLHIFATHTSVDGLETTSYPNPIPIVVSISLTLLFGKLFNIKNW